MSDENQNKVDEILALDENIRFVAISDLDGNLIVSR